MKKVIVDGRETFAFDREVFSQHCHAFEKNKRHQTKDVVEFEMRLIAFKKDENDILLNKHKAWQKQAALDGKELKDKLIKQQAAIDYACEHPMETGKQAEKASKHAMDRRAINMARKRKMEKEDDYSLDKIIESKKHHLLKNDGKDFLIFGDDKAVERLAASNVIHADGTFKCVLGGFSQLYILHATVENNVSLPALFCLVKAKNQQTYVKLLGLVEELARDAGLTIFNRDVQLMCDFELAFIKAVQQRFTSVNVKCCLFHFTQSIFKNANDAVNAIKKAAGEDGQKIGMVMQAIRRIMMLALVPEGLITPELVELIIATSTDNPSELPKEVKAFQAYILRTYVGKPAIGTRPAQRPRYSPSLWCVSGMGSRTNNAAESVHSQLNPGVSGKISVISFIHLIEERMDDANDRLRSERKSETARVEKAKNTLLAVELDKLLNGDQGVINYLDNCGSILHIESLADSRNFERHATDPVEDVAWKPANCERVRAAGIALHRRLFPESEMAESDVLRSVRSWAFQVPPDPGVHVPPSETELSLVDDRPMKIYETIKERVEKECLHSQTTQKISCADDEEMRTPRRDPIMFRPLFVPMWPMWFPMRWQRRNEHDDN